MSFVNYENPDYDPNELVRQVLWAPVEGTGLEHLRLTERADFVFADSLLIAPHDGEPLRLRYKVGCDANWNVVYVYMSSLSEFGPLIQLFSDGNGHWKDLTDNPLSEYDGCIDVDITSTPFTNTLPIRRLNLQPGESAEIDVLYIDVDEQKVERRMQRYTHIEKTGAGSVYRFEAPDVDFTAVIAVDEHGLVTDYPGLFRRVNP